jgi:vancomycin resistance protein YoaR
MNTQPRRRGAVTATAALAAAGGIALGVAAPTAATAAPAHSASTQHLTVASAVKTAKKISKDAKPTVYEKHTKFVKKYLSKDSVPVTTSAKRAARIYALRVMKRTYDAKSTAKHQFACMSAVFDRESGWSWKATNPSGYYGLGQTKSSMAAYGGKWRTHFAPQIRWARAYMDSRYGSPCGAWGYWQSHGWY